MKDIRVINRILCYIPILWFICWVTILLFGIVTFGKLPLYGIDPDPTSLSIDFLNQIAIFPAVLSIITIPATIFLSLYLIINRVQLNKQDRIAILISIVCITLFFVSKYFMSNTFNWILD